MSWLGSLPYIAIAALLAIIGVQRHIINGHEKAILKAELAAERLSNELVIEQAKTLSALNDKVVRYVERIRHIPATPDDEACSRSERMRAGSRGVRDIIQGDEAIGGPVDRLPSTHPRTRP